MAWRFHIRFYDAVSVSDILVGGLEHFLFSIRYGMSSFPLTFIFFKMVIAPPTSICGWSNGTRHGTTSNRQLSGRFAANQFQGIHGQSEDLCLGQRHDAFDMA